MNNTLKSVNDILMHFYELSRDMHYPERRSFNHFIVRERNRNLLKNFFACIEICYENAELRREFMTAVKAYYTAVDTKPIDCIAALISIQTLQHFLGRLDENAIYKMYSGTLLDYSFLKKSDPLQD